MHLQCGFFLNHSNAKREPPTSKQIQQAYVRSMVFFDHSIRKLEEYTSFPELQIRSSPYNYENTAESCQEYSSGDEGGDQIVLPV